VVTEVVEIVLQRAPERAARPLGVRCPTCQGTGFVPPKQPRYERRHVPKGSPEQLAQRILVHLLDAEEEGDGKYLAPWSATQAGVGRAMMITRAYAALRLGTMVAQGHLEVVLRHVAQSPRRHKTYRVTPAGVRAAAARFEKGRRG
jgi:hypothetical protein